MKILENQFIHRFYQCSKKIEIIYFKLTKLCKDNL